MKFDFYNELTNKCEFLNSGHFSNNTKMALSSALFMRHIPNLVFTGYYEINNNQLEIGPYQGDVIACSPIQKGYGVCGKSFESQKEIIVPNVNEFPGYISCDSITKSEIVLPIFQNNQIISVLDLDGKYLNQFDETDSIFLKQILNKIF